MGGFVIVQRHLQHGLFGLWRGAKRHHRHDLLGQIRGLADLTRPTQESDSYVQDKRMLLTNMRERRAQCRPLFGLWKGKCSKDGSYLVRRIKNAYARNRLARDRPVALDLCLTESRMT